MIVDIAQYCSSLMRHDPKVKGRGARGVMCFDEFHYHVDHHWATNYLAGWALRWASETLDALLRDLDLNEVFHLEQSLERIGGGTSARQSWRAIASEIYLPPPNESDVYPQFCGYLSLPDQIASHSQNHRLPEINEADKQRMDALVSFETRLIKQADVVLLMAMFPNSFAQPAVEANFEFYDPRTVHASSLSLTPHASVAARLGKMDLARHYLLTALRYNLDFQPRNDYLNGIHLAGYAGAFNALVEGFLGFRSRPDGISFDPKLPREWSCISLHLVWRNYHFEINASHQRLFIRRIAGPEQHLMVYLHSESRELSTHDEVAIFDFAGEGDTSNA
jgi:kojibiose phosphorylase